MLWRGTDRSRDFVVKLGEKYGLMVGERRTRERLQGKDRQSQAGKEVGVKEK